VPKQKNKRSIPLLDTLGKQLAHIVNKVSHDCASQTAKAVVSCRVSQTVVSADHWGCVSTAQGSV